MKRNIIIAMTVALTALAGSNVRAQQYALRFGSDTAARLTAGDTIVYNPVDWELELGMAYITFYVENLTDDPLTTNQHVTQESATESVPGFEVCAGGMCMEDQSQLPDYTIAPHTVYDKPLMIEPHFALDATSGEALYKLEVGNAGGLANSITVYAKFSFQKSGIGKVESSPVKVYPNPTHGRVTVGDREYDLSGRPAGVYVLPYGGSAARVIKL